MASWMQTTSGESLLTNWPNSAMSLLRWKRDMSPSAFHESTVRGVTRSPSPAAAADGSADADGSDCGVVSFRARFLCSKPSIASAGRQRRD
jgi:hypothetical protein